MQNNGFLNSVAIPTKSSGLADNNVFLLTLAGSLLVHAILLIIVLTVKLPEGVTQTDYKKWVEKLTETTREARVIPVTDEIPFTVDGVPDLKVGDGVSKNTVNSKTSGSGSGSGGGNGSGDGKAGDKSNGRRSVSNSGVLGVIGVASESGGEFADVFSSGSEVKEDVSDVLTGKKAAKAATSATSLVRKKGLGGSGTDSGSVTGSGTAEIGSVGVNAGGKVNIGTKQNIAVIDSKVSNGLDKKSAADIIVRKIGGFRRCYERALKSDADLRGKIIFEISIGDQGQVVNVRFVEDTLRTKEVTECIKSILQRLIFKRSGSEIALLRNTLVLEPQQ